MFYSTLDPHSSHWIIWHSHAEKPVIVAPMERIRKGKTVVIQEMVMQSPEDGVIVGVSGVAKGYVINTPPQVPTVPQMQSTKPESEAWPFWVKVTAGLTLIRLGVMYAEWSWREEQKAHWQLLEEVDRKLDRIEGRRLALA